MTTTQRLRSQIGRRARELRQDRRWTQTALAKLLDLSQNRLSEIEHGKGSFTAEQLLTILKAFNVTLDYFVPPTEAVSEIQNALARLGASHLAETEVLPTDRLKEVLTVIREALTAAESPRQITALAPVLVNHGESVNFARLSAELEQVGLSRRLGWLVENILVALAAELEAGNLASRDVVRYQRARVFLDHFLSYFSKQRKGLRLLFAGDDILDKGIGSEETLEAVKKACSHISRDYHIVTRIRPEDFRQALEAARGVERPSVSSASPVVPSASQPRGPQAFHG